MPNVPFHIVEIPVQGSFYYAVYAPTTLTNGHVLHKIVFAYQSEEHLNKWLARYGTEQGVAQWTTSILPSISVKGKTPWEEVWDWLDRQ